MGKTKKKRITGASNSQRRLGKESQEIKARGRKSIGKDIYIEKSIHI